MPDCRQFGRSRPHDAALRTRRSAPGGGGRAKAECEKGHGLRRSARTTHNTPVMGRHVRRPPHVGAQGPELASVAARDFCSAFGYHPQSVRTRRRKLGRPTDQSNSRGHPMNRRDAIRCAGAATAALALPAWANAPRIVLGQSAALSGPASALGVQFKKGADLLFDRVNAHGGIGGREIELPSLDDGYRPDRCAANTRKLIDRGVFALFGYIGTPPSL